MLRRCVLLMIPVSVSVARADENLFEKGLAAYQNKNYAQARDLFQQLAAERQVTAPLLHNLALTYFQLDQAPMSLALWRKALTLEPGFHPARAGRDFAESKLQSRGYERDRVSVLVQRNLEFLSFYEMLWVIALVAGITGWLWIRYAAGRRTALDEESPLPPFPVTAVALSAVLVGVMFIAALKLNASMKMRATVVVKKTGAMSLPADDGVALFELNGGSEVLIRRRDKDWSQVQNGEGNSGWVRNSDLFVTSGGA